MRFYMIDKVTHFKVGESASGIKAISLSEDFFTDHFPKLPVMPGVLVIESMAQLCNVLLEDTYKRDYNRKISAFMSIVENMKFRQGARPGDVLDIHVSIESLPQDVATMKCKANTKDKKVAEGTLFFFIHDLVEGFKDDVRTELVEFWKDGLNGEHT